MRLKILGSICSAISVSKDIAIRFQTLKNGSDVQKMPDVDVV